MTLVVVLLSLAVLVAAYALYYLCLAGKEPEVHHCQRSDSLSSRLARDMPILTRKFWPSFGLDNTHFQTLLGSPPARTLHLHPSLTSQGMGQGCWGGAALTLTSRRSASLCRTAESSTLVCPPPPEGAASACSLDRHTGTDWTTAAKDPVVTCVVLHGTQGSSRSRYIRHAAPHL